MSESRMSTEELIGALRRMASETGSLNCLGCGYEHSCGMHGCAVLKAAADELERRRWIPVAERLPDEKQRVLVRCKIVGTTAGWRLWGKWMTDMGDGGGEITHWMPLPEPPEGDHYESI